MERHDDRDALFLRHLPENIQQLDLVADIQKCRGLIQNNHLRLLADSPRQHDPLPLSIADR